jgi:hypothetical protein
MSSLIRFLLAKRPKRRGNTRRLNRPYSIEDRLKWLVSAISGERSNQNAGKIAGCQAAFGRQSPID